RKLLKFFLSSRRRHTRFSRDWRSDVCSSDLEINFTEKLSMRTGFRYSFHSKFDDQKSYSLGARYLFNKGIEARLSSGLSFRTPRSEERRVGKEWRSPPWGCTTYAKRTE